MITLALESTELHQFHSAAMRDDSVDTAPADCPPETGGTSEAEGVDNQLISLIVFYQHENTETRKD